MFEVVKSAKRVLRGGFLVMDALAAIASFVALGAGSIALLELLPSSPVSGSMLGGWGIGAGFVVGIALVALFSAPAFAKSANRTAAWFYEADGKTISAEGRASIGR